MTIENILSERQKTSGDYARVARTSQAIQRVLAKGRNWEQGSLTDEMTTSLQMIALKLARIVEGDCHHRDHFDDVAGYGLLAAQSVSSSNIVSAIETDVRTLAKKLSPQVRPAAPSASTNSEGAPA